MPPVEDRLRRARDLLAERRRRRTARPLDYARPFGWQDTTWKLVSGEHAEIHPLAGEPAPSGPPREVHVVCANQVGKTTIQGMIAAAHVQGRFPRWRRSGKVWIAIPTFGEAQEVQRPAVAAYLADAAAHSASDRLRLRRWRQESSSESQERVRTSVDGRTWLLTSKAYRQGELAFTGARLQGFHADEPMPDEILAEARIRTLRMAGYLLTFLTPIDGTDSDIHRKLWAPFEEQREVVNARRDPLGECPACGRLEYGPTWLEVAPGQWVVNVGIRDNVRSRGGFLPDDRAVEIERDLLDEGKAVEAGIRAHGDWADRSVDPLLPSEFFRPYTGPAPREVIGVTARYDPNYDPEAKPTSAEAALVVAGWTRPEPVEGGGEAPRVYVLEVVHGRWLEGEQERIVADALIRHGCPTTWIQRVSGDRMAARNVNRELERRGFRRCVRTREEATPGKIQRFRDASPRIREGRYYVPADAVAFWEQARTVSVEWIRKKKGPIDVIDAAIGAFEDAERREGGGTIAVETRRPDAGTDPRADPERARAERRAAPSFLDRAD